jgi:DNA polymerase
MTGSPAIETTWTAEPFVPASRSLRTLGRAVQGCKGCPLCANTTQAVFGEAVRSAPLVLVGEHPGDQEDKQGRPFVGPAGGVLWGCLDDVGIDRKLVFATNDVKHFRHEVRGKRRLHNKPSIAEVEACHPWIEAELRAVEGRVIVALGATAARSLFDRTMPITASRGVTLQVGDRPAIVTYHPAAVRRADETAAEIRAALVEDLPRAYRLAGADA